MFRLISRFLRLPADRAIPRQYTLSIVFLVIAALIGAMTGEKTTFLYKETLRLTASDIATLNLILAIPVYVQPFLAAFTEFVPWLGYRRRSYYALGVTVVAFGYALLGLLPKYTYATVLPLLLVVATGAVLRAIVMNAVITTVGNRTGIMARLQTVLTIIGLLMALTFTSHLAGLVATSWSYKAAYFAASALCMLQLPLLWLISDQRVRPPGADGSRISSENLVLARTRHNEEQRAARRKTAAILRETMRDRRFWMAIGLFAVIALTPFPNSAVVYYEKDSLGFSKQFIGDLGAYNATGRFLGLALFYALGNRIRIRMLPYLYVGLNAFVYVSYLCMHSALTARICYTFNGFIDVFLIVAAAVFVARLCPRDAEATIFALIGSVSTFFFLLCDKWGTFLYDHYGPANTSAHYTVVHGWNISLYVGLGMTFFAFLFIPFLPPWAHRDAPLSAPSADYESDALPPPTSDTVE